MVREEQSDQELVQAAVAGERLAFDLLMQRYQRLVYRVVRGFCRAEDDALDLTQAAFLKAYRGLSGFRGGASFKTWLLRIAHHEGVDWTRRSDLRTELVPVSEDHVAFVQPAPQERTVLAAERRRQVATGLNNLGHRTRTALVLRYLHSVPIREIAALLAVSETHAKNILFRGVRSLAKTVAVDGAPSAETASQQRRAS